MDRRLVVGLVLAAAVALAIPVGAQDGGQEGEASQDASRTVDVETSEEAARIHLRPANGSGEAPVTIGFSTQNGTLEIRHGEADAENLLAVVLDSFVEYRDENGNETFERTEPIASTWSIAQAAREGNDSVEWAPPTVTNASLGGGEGRAVIFSASLGDEGRFELRLRASGEEIQAQNTTLEPTGAAVDFLIEYPYEANGTDLALLLTTRTREEAEIATEHRVMADNEQGVVVTHREGERTANLLMAWRTSAIVDGQRRPVVTVEQRDVSQAREDPSSRPRQESPRGEYDGEGSPAAGGENVTIDQFTLSYERGEEIFHEGRAEVTTSAIEEENGAPVLPVAVALAAVATGGWLRRRARHP